MASYEADSTPALGRALATFGYVLLIGEN